MESKGLAAPWPSSGPRLLSSRPLGEGYSGIVVDDGKLYTMCRKDEREVVAALDARTGRTLWEHGYPTIVKKKEIEPTDVMYGIGPHSTPLLVRNELYTNGWAGKMHCLNKNESSL